MRERGTFREILLILKFGNYYDITSYSFARAALAVEAAMIL